MKAIYTRMIVLLVLAAMLSACGVKNTLVSSVVPASTITLPDDDNDPEFFVPPIFVEASMMYYDFDRIIEESSGIVTARLDDIDFSDSGFLLNFTRTRVIWDGEIPEKFVARVFYSSISGISSSGYGYSKKDIPFEEGKEYALPLIIYHLVFLEGYYEPLANTCILLDGEKIVSAKMNWYSERHISDLLDKDNNELNFTDLQELVEYINAQVDTSKPPPFVHGIPYVHSEDPEDIVRGSECIVHVRIDAMEDRPDDASRGPYMVSVIEIGRAHV